MLAQEFLYQLSFKLQALPQQERDVVLSYYAELISDKMENGEQEQDVIAGFGNIDQLAQNILTENSVYIAPKKKNYHPAIIVLLIVFSPILFALIITIASLAFSLLITAFALAFSFFGVTLSLVFAGIVTFLSSFALLIKDPLVALMQFGASFMMLGLSIFFGIGAFYIGKGVVIFTSWIANKIKLLFSKRGN